MLTLNRYILRLNSVLRLASIVIIALGLVRVVAFLAAEILS